MAHLWIQGEGGWSAQKLDGAELDHAFALRAAKADEPGATPGEVIRFVRAEALGTGVWALIARPDSDVRVNSRAVPAGLCVLTDRDEIRVGGEVQYFSTETLAAVEAFPGSERAMFCGRCRQQIEAGSQAVHCPNCGVWYNQSGDLPCWTYSDKCTFCGHPTALDAGFAWTPEED
ncbi:MAG: hypothetical protein WBE72_03280 [Terracidiphilus sp.]